MTAANLCAINKIIHSTEYTAAVIPSKIKSPDRTRLILKISLHSCKRMTARLHNFLHLLQFTFEVNRVAAHISLMRLNTTPHAKINLFLVTY